MVTVSVVEVHDDATVTVLRQIPAGEVASVAPDPAESFASGV